MNFGCDKNRFILFLKNIHLNVKLNFFLQLVINFI